MSGSSSLNPDAGSRAFSIPRRSLSRGDTDHENDIHCTARDLGCGAGVKQCDSTYLLCEVPIIGACCCLANGSSDIWYLSEVEKVEKMSQNFDFHHFLSGFMGGQIMSCSRTTCLSNQVLCELAGYDTVFVPTPGVAGLIVGHPFDTVKVNTAIHVKYIII